MAFNVDAFKTRASTAVVFVVIMLAGLLWSHWSFLLLFSIVHFGCWTEFQRIIGKIDADYSEISVFHRYGAMAAGYGIMLLLTGENLEMLGIPLHEWGWWLVLVCVLLIPISEVLFTHSFKLQPLLYTLVGLVYISFAWGCMMHLRSIEVWQPGWLLPVILIASIWINDTMAYLVGSFVGKTPFSKISPKKTWEGTAGGAILCVAVVTLVGHYALGIHQYGWLVGISAIAAVVGTLGDLLESKLKRMAGIKDSGSLMPGHGGFLDRFDSLVLATPFVWLFFGLME